MLLNKAHVKHYAKLRGPELRNGWTFNRVSGEFVSQLNYKVQRIIDQAIKSHRSVGKTLTDIG